MRDVSRVLSYDVAVKVHQHLRGKSISLVWDDATTQIPTPVVATVGDKMIGYGSSAVVIEYAKYYFLGSIRIYIAVRGTAGSRLLRPFLLALLCIFGHTSDERLDLKFEFLFCRSLSPSF